METVRHVLNRIRWDPEFGRGNFEIGYDDHCGGIVRVPFAAIALEEGNSFSFHLTDPGGNVLTIPFHRVREVLRDGVPIWRRSIHEPGHPEHPP